MRPPSPQIPPVHVADGPSLRTTHLRAIALPGTGRRLVSSFRPFAKPVRAVGSVIGAGSSFAGGRREDGFACRVLTWSSSMWPPAIVLLEGNWCSKVVIKHGDTCGILLRMVPLSALSCPRSLGGERGADLPCRPALPQVARRKAPLAPQPRFFHGVSYASTVSFMPRAFRRSTSTMPSPVAGVRKPARV